MKEISWEGFNGEQFQRLCNALLLAEVSIHAQVFSAQGPDGGIDQYYEGNYSGESGKWRFQDKFHLSASRNSDISAFKRDVINDIKANYKDESHIVFITNIDLTAGKDREIQKAAIVALRKSNIGEVKIHLWHHAKIAALLKNRPLIESWFWGNHSLLLEPHDVFFAKRLQEGNGPSQGHFSNKFVGRSEDLRLLHQFLEDDPSPALAISANGGFGKTRLCIEFFNQIANQSEKWLPVVLYPSAFNATDFARLLKEDRRLLILIDNANENPHIVQEAKQLVEKTEGRCKLLLTTRRAMLSSLLDKVPDYSRAGIRKMNLNKLTRDETKQFFEALLPGLERRAIIHLSELSKGIPMLIISLTQAVQGGKQPMELVNDSFFKDQVEKNIREIAEDIEKHTGITKAQVRSLIQLLSLVSPIADNEETLAFFSTVLTVEKHRIEELKDLLIDSGLVSPYNGLAIRPDPYSDVVLVETMKNKSFVDHVRGHTGSGRYFENILKNLAEANLAQDKKDIYVYQVLGGYIDQLKIENLDADTFRGILKLSRDIQYVNPSLAMRAVSYFLSLYANPDHSFYKANWGFMAEGTVMAEGKKIAAEIVVGVLAYTPYALDHLSEVHSIMEQFVRVTGAYEVIINAYGYRISDLTYKNLPKPRRCCEKQLFLKEIICDYFANSDVEQELEIAAAGVHCLLKGKTKREEYFDRSNMALRMEEAPVPNCEHIQTIRRDIITAIIQFLRRDMYPKVQKSLFGELFYLLTYCAEGHMPFRPIPSADGVDRALEYLEQLIISGPTLWQRLAIMEELSRLERLKLKSEYAERVLILLSCARTVATKFDRIELFLLQAGSSLEKGDIPAQLARLIDEYNDDTQLLSDFLAVRLKHGSLSSIGYHNFIGHFAKTCSSEVRKFWQRIKHDHPELIGELATLIRHCAGDDHYFYTQVEWLYRQSPMFDQTIAWLLLCGRFSKESKQARDLDYLQPILERADATTSFTFSGLLHQYAWVDRERTFAMMDILAMKLAKREEQRFSLMDIEHEKEFLDAFSVDLKAFFFRNMAWLPRIDSYESDRILAFLENWFGANVLLEYAIEKIQSALRGDEFAYLSLGDHVFLNQSASDESEQARFLTVVAWYLKSSDEHHLKVADYVVRLLRPRNGITDELLRKLLDLKTALATDCNTLIRLARVTGQFGPISVNSITMLCEIGEACFASGSRRLEEVLDCYSLGGHMKSKSDYGPYPEDVSEKRALEATLAIKTWEPRISDFLKKRLRYAQAEIDQEIEFEASRIVEEW